MEKPIRLGQGKYDAECEVVQAATEADCVLLMVLGGNRGMGFSVTCRHELIESVPKILRELANSIERQQKVAGGN